MVTRRGNTFEVIFYNEREWRYVPTLEEIRSIKGSFQLWGPNYTPRKDEINELISALKLKFEIDDITHIIINDDSEISLMIDHLRTVFIAEPTEKIDRLLTKISTMERIAEEF